MGTDDKVGGKIREPTTPYDDWTGASGDRRLTDLLIGRAVGGTSAGATVRSRTGIEGRTTVPRPGDAGKKSVLPIGYKGGVS